MTRNFQYIFDQGEHSNLPQFADARIVTDDECTFDVHKVLLAKCSDFFRSMFFGMDRGKTEYRVSNISGKCLSDILGFIYTKNICVTEDNIKDLIMAADYFLLTDLNLMVKMHVQRTITISNCLKLYHLAYQLNKSELSEHCVRLILPRFEEIMISRKDDLVYLPEELLKCILKNRNLNVKSERTVWHAIILWIQASIVSRHNSLPNLLSALAIDEIGEDLATEITNHDIVLTNHHMKYLKNIEFFDRNWDLLVRFLCIFSNDSQLQNFRIPRKINIISMYSLEAGISEIFISYDETPNLWRKLAEVDFETEYLIIVGCNIFIFEEMGPRCMNFNLRRMDWKRMREFSYYDRSVLTIDNCMYILHRNNEGAYDVEVYNVTTNRWLRYTPLDNACQASAVAVGKNMFVVRVNENRDSMLTQILNPISQQWTYLMSPNIFRDGFELVTYHDKIYLLGGYDAINEAIPKSEVYDPMINMWKTLPDLPFIYTLMATIIVNDQMIVYDTFSNNESGSKAIRWNEIEECWERLENSNLPRNFHQYRICPIDDIEIIKILTKQNRKSKVRMKKSPFNCL